MSRVPQQAALRGSQKWLQILINDHAQLINGLLVPRLQLAAGDSIVWLSPLKEDGYAEYRDAEFLKRLGVEPVLRKRPLADFWPQKGPQWDALARTDRGNLLLVEAKSHVAELVADCKAKSPRSVARIGESLAEVKAFLGSKSQIDWATGFYQYTNRLAHLYLLRHLNGLPAFMVFVYFVNDLKMDGPVSEREWKAATTVVQGALDLERHSLSKYVVDVFVDVRELRGAAAAGSPGGAGF